MDAHSIATMIELICSDMAHDVYPIRTSTEICGLDNAFHPAYLVFGPKVHFMLIFKSAVIYKYTS